MKVERLIRNLQNVDLEMDLTVHDLRALMSDRELNNPSIMEIMKSWAKSNGFSVNEHDHVQQFLERLTEQVKELRKRQQDCAGE